MTGGERQVGLEESRGLKRGITYDNQKGKGGGRNAPGGAKKKYRITAWWGVRGRVRRAVNATKSKSESNRTLELDPRGGGKPRKKTEGGPVVKRFSLFIRGAGSAV